MKFFVALLALASIALSSADTGFTLRSVNDYRTYDFGRQYAAIVYKLIIPRDSYYVSGIDATNVRGKGADDVETLHIVHQRVVRLPHKFFDWYKNINHLHIVDSHVESLEGETLDGRIRYVHLDGNEITTVPKTFFENSGELMLLSMERNRIEKLDGDLFVTMPKLRWVSFAGNRIRTLPGTLFRVNLNIECMSFENNGLVNVGSELVKGLEKLKGVSFDGNVCINSAYFKDTNMRDLLTKEFVTFCGGRCGTNIRSQNSIDKLQDQIEDIEEESPKCSAKTSSKSGHDHSSESNESGEDHYDHNSGRPCPHVHYNPMTMSQSMWTQ